MSSTVIVSTDGTDCGVASGQTMPGPFSHAQRQETASSESWANELAAELSTYGCPSGNVTAESEMLSSLLEEIDEERRGRASRTSLADEPVRCISPWRLVDDRSVPRPTNSLQENKTVNNTFGKI